MKKRHLIIAALSLALVSGCGASEPTTTATTQATTKATTTEATTTEELTTEAKANKNDAYLDELLSGDRSFPSVKWIDAVEEGDDKVIMITVDKGYDFTTICEMFSGVLKEGDYYNGFDLSVMYVSDDTHLEWYTTKADNYEKGMLIPSDTKPIFDVTIEDLKKAYSENQSEGGD